MSNSDNIELEGTVKESFRGGRFSVELDTGNLVNCVLSGRMRKNYIKILNGDYVTVALSPYDLSNGRITWRHAPQKKKASDDSTVSVSTRKDTFNGENVGDLPVTYEPGYEPSEDKLPDLQILDNSFDSSVPE